MADSNQDETKTERLHMLISPSELKAIDDWGYSRRIRTKAEAVRRLCQIGMAAESQIHNAQKRSERALKALFLALEKAEKIQDLPKPLKAGLSVAISEMIEVQSQLAGSMVAEMIMSDPERKDVEDLAETAKRHIETLLPSQEKER